ncbi:MAG: recombinase family protein [Magnetococcales bacterium]|nr:recombinase family protein [Magnetococcales bacterium]
MKTAIAYLRVSTADQATEGVSLEAQEAKIAAWCLLNDYTLAGAFTDAGISGKDMAHRPELLAALAACPKGGALVVYSLSRLARSTQDTLAIADRLQKKCVDLVSLSEKIDTTSASGKMVFRMLAVLAEFERDQIAERTATAMQHKKSKGELVGAVPYGHALADDGFTLVADDAGQAIVQEVKRLRSEGLNLQAIANRLTTMGFKPKGAKWYPQTIKNIIGANP